MIGTLPPLKAISPYCTDLSREIARTVHLEFLGFRKIYPERLYPGGTKRKDAVRAKRIPGLKVRNILTYYNPLTWIWAGLTVQGDIIHAQWWSVVLAPIYVTIGLLAKLRRKKLVLTVHNVVPHEKGTPLIRIAGIGERWLFTLADSLIVHSESNRQRLAEIFDIETGKIEVIPMGINGHDAPSLSRDEARQALGIVDGRKTLLFFGNIRDYKGLDVLLQAMPRVLRDFDDSLLIIAGEPWEDWNKYQDIIDVHGLHDSVMLETHFVSEEVADRLFCAADLVVLPYKYFEAQSAVAAVAAAFKRPIVVTDVGGLPDLVSDERAVAEAGSASALAESIIAVLGDPELKARLQQDLARTAEDLGWERVGRQTVKFYEKILNGNGSSRDHATLGTG